ncbi:MAG TPA: response regulator [Vicinamibacteria bacterium]|nr:response regulator [Vicinamibacteria bacterium]
MARIVLIDDHAELLAVLAEILNGAGHETVPAPGGIEGLAAVRRERPDIVLCDVNMPDLDGFGVLREMRADPDLASMPFVFLTSETEIRAGMAAGADDYLVKPVQGRELLAAVSARLARVETSRREAERRVDEVRRAVTGLLPHEIRTPLTTILGSARLLVEFHGAFEPKDVEEMAAGIVRAAERLHRMAENYILYADLEMYRLAGGTGGQLRSGQAGEVMVRAAAVEAAAHCGRSADLELELTALSVPMPPAHVGKIVSELAHNAFSFSTPGTRVRVSLLGTGSSVRLEVADRGRGMTAAQLGEIGAFRQFDRARFEQQGSGVGLALVQRIAEAGDARFELVSRPGEGTTARVHWPG